MDFKNKKVTVMGLGILGGGVAITKWLFKQGALVTVTDLKNKKELKESLLKLKKFKIKYVLGRHREADFKNADLIIQNPAVPTSSKYLEIARKNKIEVANEASLFFKIVPKKFIIGITGTRGKSTTTALLYEILKEKYLQALYGGNIKTSLMFEIINKVKGDPVVLELSSAQLENLSDIKISPHLAIITNIFSDHFNRYKNLTDYSKAKKNILKSQDKDDFVVLNLDNNYTKKIGQIVRAKRYWFSKKYFPEQNGTFLDFQGWIVFRQDGKISRILKIKEIKLLGIHNLENVLAAVTAAMVYKVPIAKIKKVLKEFSGIAGRLELIKKIKGVEFYNDTTATMPEATIAALKTLSQPKNRKIIVLIAGGADKKLKFWVLSREIKKYCKSIVLLPGSATDKLKNELEKFNLKYKIAKDMAQAVRFAYGLASEGNKVLLSPAAASFGLFKNEFDRGEQFIKEIESLK